MAKSVKIKKIIKTIGLFAVILLVLGAGVCFCTYGILTKNARLDLSLLSKKNTPFCYLDKNNKKISSTFSTVDIKDLPAHAINAFIAKEDKRFFDHDGVDVIRMIGALKNNIKNLSIVEGGSTITQQLIKNTQLSSEKTLKRKLNEIKLSKELEKTYSKEEILSAYLNTIYFGNNLFGISSASSFYFDKEVKDLTIAESAILSGLISAPSVFNPVTNLDVAIKKGEMVVNLMAEQNYITESEKHTALLELNNFSTSKNNMVGAMYISYATSEALEILGLESFPSNKSISIKTFMDTTLQKQIEEMVENNEYKANDLGGTMSDIASIVIDNATGGIMAFGGKSKYDLLTLSRQPASTIKPLLVYGPALEKNLISPASFVLDEPININGYSPNNATKTTEGWTSVRDNLSRSTNIPSVKILNQTGIEESKAFASRLGIKFGSGDNNLAIALGGLESGITIKDLADAYSTLSRGGNRVKTGFVDEIIIDGVRIYKKSTTTTKVMKDSTAYLLTDMLKTAAETGTARRVSIGGIQIASKTGTNGIGGINHDGFNISYTTEHTVACWMGNTGKVLNFSSSQFNGGLYPTYFVRDIMKSLYTNHKPSDFFIPESVETIKLDKESYNNFKIVRLPQNSSREYITEVFSKDNLPEVGNEWVLGFEEVEKATIKSNPSQTIVYPTFIKRYGTW